MPETAGRRAWRLVLFTVGLVGGLVLAVVNIATRDWLGPAAMCLLVVASAFGLREALRTPGTEGRRPSA